MGLKQYLRKRDFGLTPEPRGKVQRGKERLIYVIQKHHARRLHYDFRLEYGGTLKSWAVPKGPSLNPSDKRLAVEVEDHPIEYAGFHGTIPKGQYGAGKVEIWDSGSWIAPPNAAAALKKGHLDFELHGKKLRGQWSLIRMRESKDGHKNWLLMKKRESGARKGQRSAASLASPPDFVPPQLAQLVTRVPQGDDWVHEIKFDGYRTLARMERGDVKLLTRSGIDWSDKYGPLPGEFAKLKVDNALIDGELVCLDKNGKSSFQKLQNALSKQNFEGIAFYAFDLLFLNGKDMRELPLTERKTLLKKILPRSSGGPLRYSEHWPLQGPSLYKESCKLGLEGIVSKRASAAYLSGRSGIWQKIKCSRRQEFVIVGYTLSPAARPFAALLLGAYNENNKLGYVGRVGTGFTDATFKEFLPLLKRLAREEATVQLPHQERSVRWLKPELVAEVEFKTWTADGVLRQASFQGLRADKKPTSVDIEKPAQLRVTHPGRIVYPKTGMRKQDVVDYYEAVAPLMLPFVRDRPLSILRCQVNSTGGCYFQKHATGKNLVGIESRPVHYKDKKDSALTAESQMDLMELAQAGTLEIHAWNARFSQITRPDQIVFDLDPETSQLWPRVVETALLIRDMLQALKLQSFVKVTGGKGLHVQVPLVPQHDWDRVKDFTRHMMLVLEQEHPDFYTTNLRKAKRKGRIFLDYLRNGYGATAIVPYSLRARERPTVALPISWKEVKNSLHPDQFVFPDVLKLLKRRRDPWQGYWSLRQSLKL